MMYIGAFWGALWQPIILIASPRVHLIVLEPCQEKIGHQVFCLPRAQTRLYIYLLEIS